VIFHFSLVVTIADLLEKGINMAVRYNKLWKLLIDKEMKKVDLRDQAGLTTNVLAKLGKNEHVSTQSLEKICKTLECEVGDILEFVPDEK
jgi:DNA-binding Xre family transcriptional regulator